MLVVAVSPFESVADAVTVYVPALEKVWEAGNHELADVPSPKDQNAGFGMLAPDVVGIMTPLNDAASPFTCGVKS
jgi:hypothetical protein